MLGPIIKDFIESYSSMGIELPEGFPCPSSTDNRIIHLRKVYGVFTPEEGSKCLKTIRASKNFGPSAKFRGGKRDFYIAPTIDHFEVQFKGGKVQGDLITSPIFTKQSPNIKKIIIVAMESLAKALDWQDTTRNLACNAIDYHFTKNAEEPLEWHCDGWATESHHSFVILLSDPNDSKIGWTGGDFLYTAARVFEFSKLAYEDRKKIYDLSDATKGEAQNDPSFPIWKISPSPNDGILFGNAGMRHKITSMSPLSDEGSRMVLTVFDFGPSSENT